MATQVVAQAAGEREGCGEQQHAGEWFGERRAVDPHGERGGGVEEGGEQGPGAGGEQAPGEGPQREDAEQGLEVEQQGHVLGAEDEAAGGEQGGVDVEELGDDVALFAVGEVEAGAIGALVAAGAPGVAGGRVEAEDVPGARSIAELATGGGEHGIDEVDRAGAQGVAGAEDVAALVAAAELGGDRRDAQGEGGEGEAAGDQPHAGAVGRREALGLAAGDLSPGPGEHGDGGEHEDQRGRGEPAEHGEAGGEQADQREQAGADDHQRLEGARGALPARPAAQQRGGEGEDGEQDQHRARA